VEPDRWRRVAALLDEALDLDPAERASWRRRLVLSEADLESDLDRLLSVDAREGPLDDESDGLLRLFLDEDVADDGADVGRRLGPYHLLRELGRGGMGAVYLAERADGHFQQRVAVKVIKRGMDTDAVRRRFLVERQILARLAHPHIARLLDGGVSDDDLRPFFVVEYVEGTPLLEYSEAEGLSRTRQLELFLQVVDAVDYAHRNLVVHRDLKPSNILVTAQGGVKLLDFGIAKLLDPAADREVTVAGERPMTPAYAAPEQVRGEPITTAVDVWALGVLLCELVTGARPEAGRLPAIDDADLRNIVRMALREEPGQRYASAAALRDDVWRHLNGFPVHARADGWTYRLRKFVGRHRAGVALTGVAAALCAAAVVTALWQARLAVREAAKARAVGAFLMGIFEVSDPDRAKGEQLTARTILDRGAERLERELAGQPEVAAEARGLIGSLYRRLGLYDRARPLVEANVAWRREQGDPVPLAEALSVLADLNADTGRLDEVERQRREMVSLRRAALGESHPETSEAAAGLARHLVKRGRLDEAQELLDAALPALARARGTENDAYATQLTTLAMLRYAQRDYAGAETPMREALAIRTRLHGERNTLVAEALNNLAVYERSQGRYAEAEDRLRRVVAINVELLGEAHADVATQLNNLARVVQDQGRLAEAEELMRRALAIGTQLHTEETPEFAVGLQNLGGILREQKRYAEAIAVLRRALAVNRGTVGDEHPAQVFVLAALATALAESGAAVEAEPLFERARALVDRLTLQDHPRTPDVLAGLGLLFLETGRAARAEPLLRRALELRRPGTWQAGAARIALGRCLAALGRGDEARPLLEQGIAAVREARREDHPSARGASQALARVLGADRRPAALARAAPEENR
jgi:tetratricopeptide (TPR) repeat protein/tRNA A-37 threonylcarbamoyl transferase component Bud32